MYDQKGLDHAEHFIVSSVQGLPGKLVNLIASTSR